MLVFDERKCEETDLRISKVKMKGDMYLVFSLIKQANNGIRILRSFVLLLRSL